MFSSDYPPTRIPPHLRCGRGVSLVELMVAMTIGTVLIAGALSVFIESRETARENQSFGRMLENGEFALDELRRGIELAGYWGQNNSARAVIGRIERGDDTDPQGEGQIATNTAENPNPELPPQPASQVWPLTLPDIENCTEAAGYEWYMDLERPVEGLDASSFGNQATDANDASSYDSAGCIPDGRYISGTDILVVRHVDPVPVTALQANSIYIRSDPTSAAMFHGVDAPGVGGSEAANYAVQTHGYYVGNFYEDVNDRIPTLRRIELSSGPSVVDEPVIPGIENLQIQFGLDTNGDNSVNSFVNPDNVGIAAWDRIAAVRLWVTVRSVPACEQLETATPAHRQCMADCTAVGESGPMFNACIAQAAGAAAYSGPLEAAIELEECAAGDRARCYALPQEDLNLRENTPDGYRRLLLSRTIQVRNSR